MESKYAPSVSLVDAPKVEIIDPLKAYVAKILGLDSNLNAFWDIIDSYPKDEKVNPQLVLVHYNEKLDVYNRSHEPLLRIRGIIIDVVTGAIVCDSYGHTQSLPCYDYLSEENENISVPTQVSMYLGSDVEENAKITIGTRCFDKNTTKLFLGYEGAMVRVFKWNNKIFFSTHRRIDASKSNWGGRREFTDLYNELKGPSLESFFGNESYSPYCYMMLIAHNEIRLATSTRDNRIIFIGMKKVWDPSVYAIANGPYEWVEEYPINIPKDSEDSSIFSNDHNHSLIIQPSIDVKIANKFLFPSKFADDLTSKNDSYKAKERELVVEYEIDSNSVSNVYMNHSGPVGSDELAGGDFIIIYTHTPDGKTVVYRLESPAFEYRVKVTKNDPNLYHRFAVKMVKFTKSEGSDLHEKYPLYVNERGRTMSLKTPLERHTYWWSLFYDAVAPCYKDEVDGFLKRYISDVERIATFIFNDYPKLKDKLVEKSEERKRISPQTQERFEDIRGIATATREHGQSPIKIINNLLYKETGPSLYRMITTVRNLEKLKAVQLKAAMNK
jgi:hypothetical protein